MLRRLKRIIVPGIYEPTHRYYGFFPTTNLLKILPIFDDNDSVDIIKVQGRRTVYREKKGRRVLPYVTVNDLVERSVILQFDSTRHGKLPVKKIIKILGKLGIDTMAIDGLDIMLPGDKIYPEGETKRRAPVVAMLRSHFEHGLDAEYKAELDEHITPEELGKGLVRSSFDLMYLQDFAYWARGSKAGYFAPNGRAKAEYTLHEDYMMGITEDVETVERVMITIDPQRFLRRIRGYERGKGDVWKLTGVW